MAKKGQFTSAMMKRLWEEAKRKHPNNTDMQRKYVMQRARPPK